MPEPLTIVQAVFACTVFHIEQDVGARIARLDTTLIFHLTVAQVYLGLYAPDIAGFVLFIAVTVGVCAAVGMLLVRERAPPAVEDDVAVQRTFVAGYVLTALLATQLVGAALAGQLVPGLGGGHFKLAMTAVTAALLAATIGMLAVQQDAPQPPVPATAEPLLADTTVQKAAEVAASSRGGEAAAGLKEFSLLAAVCTLDFWILWVGFFGSSGAGLVFINNLGQIVPALGGAAVANVSTLVSVRQHWSTITTVAAVLMTAA